MDTSRHDDRGTAVALACCGSVASEGRMKTTMRRLGEACRRIFGLSGYERYVAHSAGHDEGEAAASQREFFVRSIDRKYGKSGPRCC
jgi:uncharacterized short protein YbdD (DUF466 family)